MRRGIILFLIFVLLAGFFSVVSADVLSISLSKEGKSYKSKYTLENMIIPGDSSELPDVFSFDDFRGIF